MTSGETTLDAVHVWVERLLTAAASGSALDLRSGREQDDDPAGRADWGEERTIPAEALAIALLASECDGRPLRKLRLQGASIDGTLDLHGRTIAIPVAFEWCRFEQPVGLRAVELPSCALSTCVLAAGLDAKGACIRGDLWLGENVRCDGQLNLANARVDGDLMLGGTFADPGGVAISAANVSVGGDAVCMTGFRSEGEMVLRSARVAGVLSLSGGRFVNPGEVAIDADRLCVDGTLLFRDGFEAEGEVRLLGARVGSQVSLGRGRFLNAGGYALSADGIVIDGDFTCRTGVVAEGEVRLLGARIAGDVSLRGSQFLNAGKDALSADRMAVGGGVFCGRGFLAEGEVRLLGTHIQADVDLSNGHFHNAGGRAIVADRMTVEGSLFCREDFFADGQLRLTGARIGTQLSLTGTLRTSGETLALDLEDAEIARSLFLLPAAPLEGWVDLTNATVGQMRDNDAAWSGGYELRGFRYTALNDEYEGSSGPKRSDGVLRRRLEWLRGNQSGYHPQLYEQLAEHYRAAGHDSRQRAVLIEKQRHRRRQSAAPTRAWSVVEDLLVGYGYRTWQAVVPWVVAVVLGALYFHAHRGEIVQRIPTQRPPTFHAFTYALDLLLPVVNLGQRDSWVALHGAQTVAIVLIVAGWVLTTAILAALTGLVRRTS